MVGITWVASVNIISLFQQIKYKSRKIKKVLLYNVNLDREELTSYLVSLTGL